jgi:hypothetical protein
MMQDTDELLGVTLDENERLRAETARLGEQALMLSAEISGLRRKLELARAYVNANQGGWCLDGITSDQVLERTAVQPEPVTSPTPAAS